MAQNSKNKGDSHFSAGHDPALEATFCPFYCDPWVDAVINPPKFRRRGKAGM
jgi:hypothetical protein